MKSEDIEKSDDQKMRLFQDEKLSNSLKSKSGRISMDNVFSGVSEIGEE